MDIVDPDLINEYLGLNFERDVKLVELVDTSVLIPQVQDLGFETFNTILNLGGLFCLLILYFA